MANADELRGSTPILSAREVLIEVRDTIKTLDGKVDELNSSVIVLLSQNLEPRVKNLESFKDRMIGLGYIGVALGAVGTILSIIAIIARLTGVDTGQQ